MIYDNDGGILSSEVYNCSDYGLKQNTRFSDIWSEVEPFMTDYKESGICADGINVIEDKYLRTLFFLLYARYGNDSIRSTDRNRFKYQLFSLIFQFGPTWVKRLEIQDELRELTIDEITMGSKAIFNHAYNPGTEPSTATLTELTAINEQNTSRYQKPKLEGYAILIELLNSDVTGTFLAKFKPLFKVMVEPQKTLWYKED